MNGPNSGRDVFVPMEWVIGGQDDARPGLAHADGVAVGRARSVVAVDGRGLGQERVAGTSARTRASGASSVCRSASFEGIEEVLGRTAALTYTMDAGRRLTTAALDAGEKPSVVSAILKHYNTETMRTVINDGMDVIGGKGICMGPSNFLGRAYQAIPVGITVEGANILTRSLIVFGQGAIRCHPWLMKEMEAAALPNRKRGDRELRRGADRAHRLRDRQRRAGVLPRRHASGASRTRRTRSETAKYYKRLARASAAYAFLADFAMLFLGGGLKRKEMLSGRFADGLSNMYMASAVLKRYEDTGRPAADRPLMEWSVRHCLFETQCALDQILRNFPSTPIGMVLRALVFPLGRRYRTPNDRLTQACARLLMEDGEARERLTDGIYVSADPDDVTGCIEHAFELVLAADPAQKKIRAARRKQPWGVDRPTWLQQLVAEGVLTKDEADLVQRAADATRRVIDVDDFPHEMLQGGVAGGEVRRAAHGEVEAALGAVTAGVDSTKREGRVAY